MCSVAMSINIFGGSKEVTSLSAQRLPDVLRRLHRVVWFDLVV